MNIAAKYTLFAIIATTLNIGAQDASIRLYNQEYAVYFSIIVGTILGLIAKYILDKNYIFQFSATTVAHNTIIFTLYTFTGIATTAIFWGAELLFHHLFDDKLMRYLGGVIGLIIGYIIKYRLDKNFVFVRPAE